MDDDVVPPRSSFSGLLRHRQRSDTRHLTSQHTRATLSRLPPSAYLPGGSATSQLLELLMSNAAPAGGKATPHTLPVEFVEHAFWLVFTFACLVGSELLRGNLRAARHLAAEAPGRRDLVQMALFEPMRLCAADPRWAPSCPQQYHIARKTIARARRRRGPP